MASTAKDEQTSIEDSWILAHLVHVYIRGHSYIESSKIYDLDRCEKLFMYQYARETH